MTELKVESENEAVSNLNESLIEFTVKNFTFCKVKVETLDGISLEGLLIRVFRSRHNGVGSLILKNESGVHLIKSWIVIAKVKCNGKRKAAGEV